MEPSGVAEKPRGAQSTRIPVVRCNASYHNAEPPLAMRSSRANASSRDKDANTEDAFVHTAETAEGSGPSMVACTTNRAMTSPCSAVSYLQIYCP